MNGHETPHRITPWRETWRQLIRSAAPHQVALRRSLLELLAAAALQGMALACLLPIFRAFMPAGGLANGNGTPGFGAALPWLVLFTVCWAWRCRWCAGAHRASTTPARWQR